MLPSATLHLFRPDGSNYDLEFGDIAPGTNQVASTEVPATDVFAKATLARAATETAEATIETPVEEETAVEENAAVEMVTLDFDCNGHAVDPEDIVVEKGSIFNSTDLPVLSEEGWLFDGWYLYGQPFQDGTVINENVILTAAWTEAAPASEPEPTPTPTETITATFNLNGHGSFTDGTAVNEDGTASIRANESKLVTPPADPQDENWEFQGWSYDETGSSIFDPNQPIRENITLYACWTEKESEAIAVTFDLNGHGSFSVDAETNEDGTLTVNVDESGKIALPADPKDERFDFQGWTLDKEGKKSFDANSAIEENATLYAQWEKATSLFTMASTPSVSYQAHVSEIGWMSAVSNGATAGTTGRALQVEAIKIQASNLGSGSIRYQAHVSEVGWQGWKSAGQVAGTTGQNRKVEAVKIELTGDAASKYDILYRVHVPDKGWLAWSKNGELAGTTGKNLRVEALQVKIVEKGTASTGTTPQTPTVQNPSTSYQAHVGTIGWMSAVSNGATAGTTGRTLQVEAFKINASNLGGGSIRYQAHVSEVGWQGWKSAGQVAGTTGQNRKVEAIKIELTGDAASKYDVLYRVHVPEIGWLAWTKNGATAGSTGMNLRIEAFQVKIVKKGTAVSGVASLSKPKLTAKAHSSKIGWQSAVSEGATIGTTGRALSLEAIQINFKDFNGSSSAVSARAHVSGTGWMSWVGSSQTVGTTGKNKQMEAIQIKLNGNAAKYYDIYYRAHVRDYGWLGWAKNGETAGSTGMGKPMEALQVKVVRKGTIVSRGGSAVAQPKKTQNPAQSSYDKKVNAFLNDARWRNGTSWGYSQKPKLSNYPSKGCCAYTADFCKYVFGKTSYRSGTLFKNPSEIRAGDVIKVTGSEHWFVVLYRNGNSLYTAEGNYTKGKVVVANGAYTIRGNTLYRDGKKFRTFSAGYHMK